MPSSKPSLSKSASSGVPSRRAARSQALARPAECAVKPPLPSCGGGRPSSLALLFGAAGRASVAPVGFAAVHVAWLALADKAALSALPRAGPLLGLRFAPPGHKRGLCPLGRGSAVLACLPPLVRDVARLRTSCSSGRLRFAKAVPLVRRGLRPPRKRRLRRRRAANDRNSSAYGSTERIRFIQSAGFRRPCQTAKTTISSSSTQ